MTVQTARCRSCDAAIVWMRTNREKNIPVDADSVDEAELEFVTVLGKQVPLFDYQQHVAHFTTCPDSDFHRRSR